MATLDRNPLKTADPQERRRRCLNPACKTGSFTGVGHYIYPVPDGILPDAPRPNVGLLMCAPCGAAARDLQLQQGLVKVGR